MHETSSQSPSKHIHARTHTHTPVSQALQQRHPGPGLSDALDFPRSPPELQLGWHPLLTHHIPGRPQPSCEPTRTSLGGHESHPEPRCRSPCCVKTIRICNLTHQLKSYTLLKMWKVWSQRWEGQKILQGTNLSPSDAVSILMKPAQLIKTLGPMWHMVTSWVLFSRRVLFCFKICVNTKNMITLQGNRMLHFQLLHKTVMPTYLEQVGAFPWA